MTPVSDILVETITDIEIYHLDDIEAFGAMKTIDGGPSYLDMQKPGNYKQ